MHSSSLWTPPLPSPHISRASSNIWLGAKSVDFGWNYMMKTSCNPETFLPSQPSPLHGSTLAASSQPFHTLAGSRHNNSNGCKTETSATHVPSAGPMQESSRRVDDSRKRKINEAPPVFNDRAQTILGRTRRPTRPFCFYQCVSGAALGHR